MSMSLLDADQCLKTSFDDTTGSLKVFPIAASLVPAIYDYIALTYSGSDLTTVVYKTGGSSGTTVATLTLVYDGSHNLQTITKA